MSGLDTYGPPAPEMQGPPAPTVDIGAISTPFDPAAAVRSAELQTGYEKAMAAGDSNLAGAYRDQQIAQARVSQGRVDLAGLPPETRAPNNAVPNTHVEIQRMLDISRMRMEQADMILEKHNWKGELEDWFTGDVLEQYKAHNSSQLMVSTEGMDPQQKLLAQEQLNPLVMDPMLVADKRQRLAQIDADLKLVHPNLSIFNYEPTRRVAGWINREAALGGGYITSGEVEGVGFLGETGGEISEVGRAGVEAVAEFPLQLVYGSMNLVGWTPPSNYVEGPNGEIITNAGKIPNITETWIAVAAQLQGRNVAQQLAKHGKLSQIEQSKLNMVQQMSRGVASVIGIGFGFGMAAGKAMGTGQKMAAALTTKGLVNLAASGSPRTARILQVMSSTAGAAVGNGLAEGLAFGRHDGYLKAFQGGAAIAPVLMLFGAAGNRVEHLLRNRKKMPAFLKRNLAGGVEGLGFGVMGDVHQYQAFEGSLWDYMRDPTQARWQMYLQNVIGMSIFKGVRGKGAIEAGVEDPGLTEALTKSRTALRKIFAVKVAEAEAPAEKPEVKPVVPDAGEEIIGEIDKLLKEAKQPMEIKGVQPSAEKLMEQAGRGELAEPEMISKEEVAAKRTKKEETQGRDPLEDPDFMQRPEAERRAISEAGTAKERRLVAESFEGPERRQEVRRQEEPELPAVEELRRLQAEGPNAANRKRLLELLEKAKGAYFGKVGEFYKKLGEQLPAPIKGKAPPKAKAPVEEVPTELAARREQYRETAREAGIDYDLVRELGEEIIRTEKGLTVEERQAAFDKIRDVEERLDVQELLSDPTFNPQLKAELQERHLEALETGEIAPQREAKAPTPTDEPVDVEHVDPFYGERWGPGSMRAGANPYRQQESKALDKALDIMISEIFQIMEGKQDVEGVRIGKWRPFRKRGSPVQVAMLKGHMGRSRAAGLFKIYENVTRTREGQDLMVGVHEWSHVMHRQVYAKAGGDEFWKAAAEQWETLPINAKLDVLDILRRYPGAAQLTRKELMAEAWSEWHTRYLSGEQEFLERYPDLSREMLAWLNAPENRAFRDGQYKDMAEALQQWKDMGSRRRMGMTIRRQGRKPRTYDPRIVQRYVEKAVRAVFDDNIALKNSQARWLKRSDLKAEDVGILMDPSRMIDTVQMTATKEAESFMLNGPHDLAFRRREGIESYQAILDGVVGDFKGNERNARVLDFVDLLYGIRAIEKIDKGKIMPLPKSDYVRGISDIYETNPDYAGKPEAMKRWSDSLLDLLVEAGQVGVEDARKMKDEGMVYIPFVRMIEGAVSRFQGGRGVAEQGTGVKGFRGGSRDELMDPVQAMADVTRNMIVKARKQMVVRSMYRLMLETDIGGLVTQVPKDNVPARYRLDQTLRQMKKGLGKEMRKREEEGLMEEMTIEEIEEQFGVFAELVKDNELSETLITLFGQKDMPFGEKDPILAYVPRLTDAEIQAIPSVVGRVKARENNGKMIWLQLDGPAFEAFMGIDAPISRLVIDSEVVNSMLRKPAQVLRIFATDANPAFAVANLIRDAASVSVFNRQGKFSPFMGWQMAAQGAAMLIRHGSFVTPMLDKMLGDKGNPVSRAIWEMFDASGASTSSFFNEGVQRKMRGQTRTFAQKANAALDAWRRMVSAPESYIRLAEFSRIVQKGAREAADLAKGEKLELEHITEMEPGEALEVSMEALEGAREITINFARAGDIARAYNQMTPYFTATLAAQRKMMRSLLGMEGKTDAERFQMQRMAWANGMIGITVPTMAIWALVKDEDWYKDLPEWRKRHFVNFKMPGMDEIISLPLPFELGVIFGSIPMALTDHVTDSNPVDLMDSLSGALFPYFEHTSSWVPAAVKPIAEVVTGYDLFRERPLTPFWVEKTKAPGEQVRQGTTATAQWLFKKFPPMQWVADNPIELEQLFGGYTAGFTTTLMRAWDEVNRMKDHPGLTGGIGGLNPINTMLNRFMRQTPHAASRTVDDFYAEAKRIEQTPSGERTPQERSRLTRINRAKEEFSRLRREVELGRMDKLDADRRMFEMANRIIGSVK